MCALLQKSCELEKKAFNCSCDFTGWKATCCLNAQVQLLNTEPCATRLPLESWSGVQGHGQKPTRHGSKQDRATRLYASSRALLKRTSAAAKHKAMRHTSAFGELEWCARTRAGAYAARQQAGPHFTTRLCASSRGVLVDNKVPEPSASATAAIGADSSSPVNLIYTAQAAVPNQGTRHYNESTCHCFICGRVASPGKRHSTVPGTSPAGTQPATKRSPMTFIYAHSPAAEKQKAMRHASAFGRASLDFRAPTRMGAYVTGQQISAVPESKTLLMPPIYT